MTGRSSAQPDPLDAAIVRQSIRRMLAEFATLTARQRIIIRLRYVEQRTWQAIGEQLSVTEVAVIRVHKRAIETLRRKMTSCK